MKILLLLLLAFLSFSCSNNYKKKLSSPDGNNVITFSLMENGKPYYSVESYGSVVISQSKLGIEFGNPKFDFSDDLEIISYNKGEINETYELPTGKTKVYHNHANTGEIKLRNKNGSILTINLRAYDDGIAFKYELSVEDSLNILSENTEINLNSTSSDSWIMDYIKHYEAYFPKRDFNSISNKELSYPSLIHLNREMWMLITEASVYKQPATRLKKETEGNQLSVILPEAFQVGKNYQSPWRTFIIGRNLATIVESVLVENLNPDSDFENVNWIEPGVAVFPWWGNYMANSYIDTLKMYVDMASEMNWEWIEFDVSLVNSTFRTSKDWRNASWLSEFTAYAKVKGIKVYGWDEINVLSDEMDYVYGRYRDLGIRGIKIDYINSDAAYAMRFRDKAMRVAEKYKLHVSFHGETMPRGQRRKYPNLMTAEAVKGAEYYTFKDADAPTPQHNCTLPFTRNVVGPMDYTPATLTIRPENPRKTTYAHELALPVIFESGWTVMADCPDAYLNSPAKHFLQQLKATWDETVFIDGYPGEFVCLARRNGSDWYLAAINASEERDLIIPLDFLKEGSYNITLYKDHPEQPMTNVKIIDQEIFSGEILNVHLNQNGGFCTVLKGKSE